MDESFEFEGYILNLYTYMGITLKFVDANRGILDQNKKSSLYEIVDTINIAISKDSIYNLGEEWIMDKLTRLIDIKFHCLEKGRFPATLEKSKNARYFHISLLKRLHSVYYSFRKDFGEFDVDDDYYDGFSKEVEDALDEDSIEDALNNCDEDWLILSIKYLIETRKKLESAKGKKVTKRHKKAVNTKDEVGVKNPKPAEVINISCSFPSVWNNMEQTDEMKNGIFFQVISQSIIEEIMGFDLDEIYKKEDEGLFMHTIDENGVVYRFFDVGKAYYNGKFIVLQGMNEHGKGGFTIIGDNNLEISKIIIETLKDNGGYFRNIKYVDEPINYHRWNELLEACNKMIEKTDNYLANTKINSKKKLTVPEIYHLTPQTNCKECGCPTCYKFASTVALGPKISIDKEKQMTEKSLMDCPYIELPQRDK